MLIALVCTGDFVVGSSIAAALTKLVLRSMDHNIGASVKNALSADVMLILTSMLSLGQSPALSAPVDADCYDRIAMCVRVLAKPDPIIKYVQSKHTQD